MALAFYVNGPDDIAYAFAAHDEYLALFTHFYFHSRKDIENIRALRPDIDDYYSAPYCFLSWKDSLKDELEDKDNNDGGFLVFTYMVPYLHGNPWTREIHPEYQTMDNGIRAYDKAREWMKRKGTFKDRTPYVGTVESFQIQMKLGTRDRGVYTFTVDGGYPTCEDVSQSLEEKAVGIICSTMKWKVPTHWRVRRAQLVDLHNIPILDLALWDTEKKQQQQQQQQQQQPLLLHSQQKEQDEDDVEEYDEESSSEMYSSVQEMDEDETANLLLGLGGNIRHTTTEYSNNDKYEYDDYNDTSNDDYNDIDSYDDIENYDEFYDDDDDDDGTNDRATKIQRNEEAQQYGWYNDSSGGDDNKNVVHNDYEQEEKKDCSSSLLDNNIRTVII